MQSSRSRLIGTGSLVLLAAGSCHAGTGREDAHKERAASNAQLPAGQDAPIGSATREADGTIVLSLRAKGRGEATGDARFRYAPTDKDYVMIARHVGPIPHGRSVLVKPFAAGKEP